MSVKLPVWAWVLAGVMLLSSGYWWTEHAKKTWVDEENRRMWTLHPSDEEMSWREAVNYCNGMTLADFKDWQLPTEEQLSQLWDEKAKHAWGIKRATLDTLLWSATSIGKDGKPGADYATIFDSGNWGLGIIDAQTKASAVCVRPLDYPFSKP